MTVFNIELFGTDADWFCSLSNSDKFTWIKANTNQIDDTLINQFLASPIKNNKEYCFECRGKKQKTTISEIVNTKENGNISVGNAKKAKKGSE